MTLDAGSFKGLSRFLAPAAGGPLADRALAEKLITPEQLQECISEQDRSAAPLDEILVARGFLTKEAVDRLRQPELPAEVVAASADPKNALGKYQLVSRAGQGGMAEVWKAWDRSLGRWVAVKFLKAEVGHPVQRLEREGRMAGGLSHPGIISIYERGQHPDGRPFLVMPFVEGRGLQPPLPAPEALRVTLEVARALEHVHAAGVIHRDVKPGNILLAASGRVLLADFGLAIPGGSAASRWAVSGTPEYASPEQVRGDVLDAGTDIYSLGATLYHLLEGRPPFSGRDAAQIGERVLNAPPPPLPSTPARAAAVVRKAMERDRAKRYRTMKELAEDLARVAEGPKPKTLGVKALVAVIAAGLFPWVVAAVIAQRFRAAELRLEIQEPLMQGRQELAQAERLAAEPEPSPEAVAEAVRRAMALFRRSSRVASGNSREAWAGLGRCYEMLGRDPAARHAWEQAGSLPEALLGLARNSLRLHFEGRREYDWLKDARKLLKRADSGRTEDPCAALVLYCEGRWAEAYAAGSIIAAWHRSDDVFQLALGIAARECGKWTEALELFGQSLKARPDNAAVAYQLALGYAQRGEKADALAWAEETLRTAPVGWGFKEEAQKLLDSLK